MSLAQLYDFHGKTALITGASGGLGEQFARSLCSRGARVLLASRSINKLKNLSDELGNAQAIQMDVADKTSIVSCFRDLEQAGEKIDICVNNAGIVKLTPIFAEEQSDNFESMIQTNLVGVWYVTRAVANHMKTNSIHGSIINIASINGDAFPYKETTGYAISKAAVIHMSKALVTELSPYKIRINTISPGLFCTPMTSSKVGTQKQQEELANLIPLGFVANPQDLDSALMFLAHNEHSAYMTGANITVDGGKSWGVTSW